MVRSKNRMTSGAKMKAVSAANSGESACPLPEPQSKADMIAEKEQASGSQQSSSDEERRTRADRISQAIRNLPDYTKVDDTGFYRDLWDAFKDDTKRIWRGRKAHTKTDAQP